MDKHTRPYVCDEPGCENIRGFTYSGGLSRHRKEVHRHDGGPKGFCMCPYTDCKRNTGVGFSRRENLQEHIRRCHKSPEEGKQSQQTNDDQSLGGGSQNTLGSRKRKRRARNDDGAAGEGTRAGDDDSQSSQGLREEVKRLRREVQEKDERLSRLEEMMKQLEKSQRSR